MARVTLTRFISQQQRVSNAATFRKHRTSFRKRKKDDDDLGKEKKMINNSQIKTIA